MGSLFGISDLQTSIMSLINNWGQHNHIPITRKQIIADMKDISPRTTEAALNVLCKKGYIRRAVTISNSTSFVQLRGI